MERRMKAKQGMHPRSKSFSEEPVHNLGNSNMHRQTTYDDSQTRKMDVEGDQDVWMNSFSSWKMKRIKATSTERVRKAERDEVEESQEKLRKRKSKTFREIVEEKQRREKFLQSGAVKVEELGAGEITNILADLPSTNLDSDNEQEENKSPSPPMEEERTKPRLEWPRGEEKQVPDRRKELRQRSNTLPTNNPTRDESVKRVPPPVKPKPRSRSGSLRDRSNSVEQKFIEPEIFTTTDSRTTYSAPPPSMRPASEVITATNTGSTYAAPPPATWSAPATRSAPVTRSVPLNRSVPLTRSAPETRSVPETRSLPASRSLPAKRSPPAVRRTEPEPVEKPVSFHDKLHKARQYEKETDDDEQKAKEAARKVYKPKRSSIFAKIRAFDTGEAFKKDKDQESVPKVEEKAKPDIEDDDFEDLVIIMSQKARSHQGFGFQTSGGYDEKKPLVVSSVKTGSVADFSDLKVGDQILSINKESTKRFNQEDVHQCLSQSILTGKLTCKVRRYPDGKVPETTAVKEPNFHRTFPSKQESQPPPVKSQPPPVQSQPPPVQSQPPPARQPVRTWQPPVESVTSHSKQEPADTDIDVLRPGPTKNALARARQMLDNLEMEDESLESSSKSSDIVDSSSVPPTNRLGNKPFYSQPIKSNGYVPHGAESNSMDNESLSSEDSRQSTQRYRPTLQTQDRVSRHTPTSSQDEGYGQEYQPKTTFRSGPIPKAYQTKAPEPYKPPSSRDLQEPVNSRSDINQRRNEFFPDEDWKDKPQDDMDNLWKQVEEPVVAADEETSEMAPTYIPIKPSTAHRRPFNREEERKRLERWNEEQERRRQEKYQQEQQRLLEEQERTLQAATEDVQKKRSQEERSFEERRKALQRQQEELREIRQKQIEDDENRRKARLEQERRDREEAERERKEAEERREKERAEEERKRKEMMEKERILREAAEKERLAREKEEEDKRERERLQREREQREKAARDKMRREREEYAKMLKEREREKQEQAQMRAEAEQKRQDEEEADHERQEIEKWKVENEERGKAAKLKAEQGTAMQEEAQRKFEAEERERIRAEEREKMRLEWEEERKRDLEQLRMDKELLQKEREEMAKRQEEEKRKLQLEMERVRMEKELEQKKAPVIEVPVSKITNGVEMSAAPKQQLGMSQSPRNRHSPQNGHGQSPRNGQSPRTVSPGTQRIKENNQKNMFPERDQPPSHSIMSQYKDPNIPVNQHWLIEEAERRRRAEVQGVERKMPPDVIIQPHGDLQAPQKATHSRQPNAYPRGFNPEIPTKIPAQRKLHSQEAPASTNAAQRRLRRPEAEADHQRKMKNRRSLPDAMAGGRDNAVPGHGHSNNQTHGGQTTEPPISRSSDRGQHSIPGQGSAFQEPNKNIPPNQSVSGKLQCCNCSKSLGRGAAMIIESLGLHYHVECFRCCVCSIRLGNGNKGTDVRIRASQLHCQNCYSNEAGFQFTEV